MKKPFLTALLGLSSTLAFADGDVIIDLGANSQDVSSSLALAPDGSIYLSAYKSAPNPAMSSLLAFDASGSPIVAFGTNGSATVADTGPIAVRADGSLITGYGRIVVVSQTGTQLSSVDPCSGAVTPCGGAHHDNVYFPLADGRTFGGGGKSLGGLGSDAWVLRRIGADGNLDPAFANGAGWTQKDGGASREIGSLRSLAGGQIAVLGTDNYFQSAMALSRFNSDGSTDFSFGTNGLVALPMFGPFTKGSLGIDQSQRWLVPGGNNVVARYNPDGTPDNTYVAVARLPGAYYIEFEVDSQDRVLVFSEDNDQIYVARLLPNGGLDPAFGTNGETRLSPARAGSAHINVTAGAVDTSNRPLVLFSFQSDTGNTDIGLLRLTTGGIPDVTFGAAWADADAFPDTFNFASSSAPFGTTVVQSDTVTPTGFNRTTSVALHGGPTAAAFSVGCNGTFSNVPTTISPGQSVCLRHPAPAASGQTVTTYLNVGGRVGAYTTTATTTPADVTPESFAFTDQTDVATGAVVTSNTITINGLTGAAPVSVDFGQYSIGCNPNQFRSNAGVITNGETVCVRVTSSASFATPVSATLAIGGVTDTFTATTLAADTTPDAFAFTNQGGVVASSSVTSNSVTIAGINAAAAIAVTTGEYSIGCNGTFTAAAGTINAGQSVCVRHTASSQPSSSVSTALSIGGVNAMFTSTTAAPTPTGGGGGALSSREILCLALLLAGAAWRRRLRRGGDINAIKSIDTRPISG